MITEQTVQPEIYVASLSDYNAGRLHGCWIPANQPAEKIADEVDKMLRRSSSAGAEEWAIHDHSGFAGIRLGEWERFSRVAAIAAGLSTHGEAFAAWYGDEVRDDLTDEELGERFEEAYAGHWPSFADFARELAEDLGAMPEDAPWPLSCIDWERAARELRLGGDYIAHEGSSGGVHVFRGL